MIVLGCTGSIGVNTLEIAKKFNIAIDVMVAGQNIELLNIQLKTFNPRVVVIADSSKTHLVNHTNVKAGQTAIIDAIKSSPSNLVVNALVGFAGLLPTITALQCNKKLALANKESLVVAGKFLDSSSIIPIDSEHFGLWYIMDKSKKIDSITITASGGSFRDYPLEKLSSVTVKEALNHPNWSMGSKITIDSATMTNKLFELIEAKWLFNTTKCDAIIETKSIIHALVNFTDGSTTAHFAHANMQLPIAYAILDKVESNILPKVDLVQIGSLEFKAIEHSRYPIWELKDELLQNDNLGVVLNAANEVAVAKFLSNQIPFLDISKSVMKAVEYFHGCSLNSIDDLFQINKEVREWME
ncbi:MAG: 1-deoxy-D-xylulose-5-phosphate reductoisomerase [Campylobacterales bacterium]|nr:1-deoxy-D-xylulose-5-phosphate reductoisomerase [Campylobacterales bacterium]